MAIFDLDGTIMSTNVVEQYLWARLPVLPAGPAGGRGGQVARRLPGYLLAEQRDRGSFLRAVYRRYRGLDLAALEHRVDTTMAPSILSRLSGEARQRILEHRAAGHTTILITGAVRTFTRPLQELFDVIVAAELGVDDDGRCTGFLTTPPLVGESRAAWLKHYAALHGVDLSRSFAYADSHSDLPMLQTVGQPVAVSPDISLMRAAQQPVVDRGMEDQADHATLGPADMIVPPARARERLVRSCFLTRSQTGEALSAPRSDRQGSGCRYPTLSVAPPGQAQGGVMMLALEMYRGSLPKYIAARTMVCGRPGILSRPCGTLAPGQPGAAAAPRSFGLGGAEALRLSGISGSDLAGDHREREP